MPARPIDAAEGYRFFRQHDGHLELDEINEHLEAIGLRRVSPRMYIHYRRLSGHSYESYIPINRFDVAVAGDHAWSEDLRARYAEVSQAVPAEILWEANTQVATATALGVATASVTTYPVPPAGAPVVLRLVATGITKAGRVVRTDPNTGLVHIAFDPYSSVPVAASDSPYRGLLRFPIIDSSQSVVAVADLMLRLDRLMTRVSTDGEEAELARLSSLSLNSPLEILLVGSAVVAIAIRVATQAASLRLTWYEGTKAKYEAEGIQLDNDQKRRAAQLEADRALDTELVDELNEGGDTPILDHFDVPGLPKGEPGSNERNKFIDAIRLAFDLPADLDGGLEQTAEGD